MTQCVRDEYSLRENPGLIILCKYVSVTYKLCSRVYTVSSPLCYGEKCNISALYFLCHSLLFSVKDVFECVCVREIGCVHTSPSLLLNCFLFEVRTIAFCTCEWFFLFSSLIQCSLPFCKSKMLYLLHATALMQLYNPPLCSFVFNLFLCSLSLM